VAPREGRVGRAGPCGSSVAVLGRVAAARLPAGHGPRACRSCLGGGAPQAALVGTDVAAAHLERGRGRELVEKLAAARLDDGRELFGVRGVGARARLRERRRGLQRLRCGGAAGGGGGCVDVGAMWAHGGEPRGAGGGGGGGTLASSLAYGGRRGDGTSRPARAH
jgi:hypothetical protein